MKLEKVPGPEGEPAWLVEQAQAEVQKASRPAFPKVMCILPAFNEARNLPRLVPMLDDVLRPICAEYSVLVVDDGSSDATAVVAVALGSRYPVKLLQLSRNFGKESAITAGLDHIGSDIDAAILMDSDCQHPAELLPVFLEHWKEGYDTVYGVINNRSEESAAKRHAVKWFYSLLSRSSTTPIVPDAGDFRLFDRKVIAALRALPERTRFMKGLYSWVGFHSKAVPYKPAPRHEGQTNFNLRGLTRLALTGFLSFSEVPLRIWSGLGAIVSLCSIAFGAYIALRTLIFGIDLPGWATLSVGVTLLGGLQLLSIGILGEYVGRIFNEVKGRPVYLIRYRYGFEEDKQDK